MSQSSLAASNARSAAAAACACALAFTLASGAVNAASDPYLESLEREVAKVEVAPTDNPDAARAGAAPRDPAAGAALTREQFEDLLSSEHVGTYSFYRRLPERSRQEIYLEYRSGVPVGGLREKIVQRFLNP